MTTTTDPRPPLDDFTDDDDTIAAIVASANLAGQQRLFGQGAAAPVTETRPTEAPAPAAPVTETRPAEAPAPARPAEPARPTPTERPAAPASEPLPGDRVRMQAMRNIDAPPEAAPPRAKGGIPTQLITVIVVGLALLVMIVSQANNPDAPWNGLERTVVVPTPMPPAEAPAPAAEPGQVAEPTAMPLSGNADACIMGGADLYWDLGQQFIETAQTDRACTAIIGRDGSWVRVTLADGGAAVWVQRSQMGANYPMPTPTPLSVAPVAPQAPPVAYEYCVDPGDGHRFCASTQAEADRQALEYVRSGQMIANATAVAPTP